MAGSGHAGLLVRYFFFLMCTQFALLGAALLMHKYRLRRRLEHWGVPVAATVTQTETIQGHRNGRKTYKLTVAYRTDEMAPNHFIVWENCETPTEPESDDTILLRVLPYNPRVAIIVGDPAWGCFSYSFFTLILIFVAIKSLVAGARILSEMSGLSLLTSEVEVFLMSLLLSGCSGLSCGMIASRSRQEVVLSEEDLESKSYAELTPAPSRSSLIPAAFRNAQFV